MADARTQLLDRVIAHVAEAGLADLSLRELATGAGTSHRMLIYHFGSRAGLVAAIAHRIETQQRESLTQLAEDANDPDDLQRRTWAQVSDPAIAPFVRIFFDVLALALAGREGTEQFLDDLVDPWLDVARDAAVSVGMQPDDLDLRLGLAVTRGLLIDVLATGDVAGATAAHERFIQMWADSRD
jgi:AcrR family transcriptional regulator